MLAADRAVLGLLEYPKPFFFKVKNLEITTISPVLGERLAQQDRSGGSFLNCIIVILGFRSEGHSLIREIQSHRSVVPGRILEVALSILAILKVECHGDFREYVTWNWHGD